MNPGKTLDLIQKKAMKKSSARSPKDRNLIRRSQITDHRSKIEDRRSQIADHRSQIEDH